MAYIQPNSTVEFFADIGLNDNYDDSLYFATETDKNTYFGNLEKLATATAMSYSRQQRGFIRVELPMSTLINASYMRFKNTSFENKWFYAFVNNAEYINNNCTQINFSLDPLITWMGTFTLNQCYIERQHTLGDAIGANICEESINCGEYVTEGSSMTAFFGSYKIGVFKTYNPDKDDVTQFPISQGTYAPIITYFYPLTTAGITTLNELISRITKDNRIDEIICMKLVPEHWSNRADTTPPIDTFSVTKPYSTIAGYIPRNNKLFTFPFKYLQVENCEGDTKNYKYEYFNTLPDTQSTGEAYFQIMGTSCTPEINIMCTPKNYNGEEYSWDESLTMRNFPNVAWNVDTYKAYIAQRDSTIFGNITANLLSAGIGAGISGGMSGIAHNAVNQQRTRPRPMLEASQQAAMSAGIGTVQSGISGLTPLVSDVINDLMSGMLPSRFANQTRGGTESNLMVQSNNKNFYFRRKCITKNYAMMIDNFFDMFGYAIKQHGVPNMNARPNWTYVKTIGCSVSGHIPADDASAIEDIFNHGVRFWKNHNNIGNYNLNNAPA